MFTKGPTTNTVFLTVIVVSVLLLLLAKQTNQLNRFKQAISFITHPILIAVDSPANAYHWATDTFSSHAQLLAENDRLKTDSLLLKAKLQKFEAIEQENIRLQSLLGSSFKLGEQFLAASIIRTNLNPLTHQVVIDKGSRFKLYKNQAALTADGVIGQVIDVNPLSASIILLTDPNHAIPVEISRTGLRTIAVGSGNNNVLNLPYLPHNSDIRLDDLLITSGMGGLYPKGYPVARVSELAPAPGQAFMTARAITIARIETSREVLLVWSQQQPIPILSKEDASIPEESNTATSNE
ncbi:MAG: rod shape-determining protein MreC [Piscirickettsiaceae bacterium]|nr:MAG: rod shape-determining protein MreC [Piscirickettsiaceae bacterium]